MLLFTNISLDLGNTRLALDRTTPLKLALALLLLNTLLHIVATAAAHNATTVGSLRVLVARSTVRAEQAQLALGLAEVLRIAAPVVMIDKVLLGGLGVARVPHAQLIVPRRVAHLNGRVVLVAQVVADLAERGQLEPTRLHAARARHAMAFALDLDETVDGATARLVVVQVDEAAHFGTTQVAQ